MERSIELSHAPAELIEKYIEAFFLARSEYEPCVSWLLRLHASAATLEEGESFVERMLNVALDHAQDVRLADQAVAVYASL